MVRGRVDQDLDLVADPLLAGRRNSAELFCGPPASVAPLVEGLFVSLVCESLGVLGPGLVWTAPLADAAGYREGLLLWSWGLRSRRSLAGTAGC